MHDDRCGGSPRREGGPPPDLLIANEGFATLGALLLCADERRWDSIARPTAHGLGLIVQALREHLATGIQDLGTV